MPLFPSIYFEEDSKFNTPDVNAIKDLILAIDELNVDEKFIDSFSTTCGDIHEAFRAYGGRSSGAKELGQYFTPRHLIHLMFHGLGLDTLLDNDQSATIYDPCMGTGGFLTRLFKMATIPSNNIYGCETEQDTIKFGEMSMLLTTGDVDNHIKKCNSISENEFISQGKRFSAVVTNPPFGTSMKYDQLMKTYETRFPNSDVNFTEVYPLKMNNGAGLFIQHCVHMLADGGVCAIVLPDGELFEGTSGWSKKLRKWLSEQVNIRTILKVPSGTFEHAGVKTNVVVFTKDGPTQNIRFIETTKECDTVKEMFTISSQELKTSGYSLDVGEYLVEETYNYDVPMVALGEVCDFKGYKYIKRSDMIEGEYKVIGGGKKPSGFHNEFNKDANTILCSGTGSYAGYISKYSTPVWASESFSIHSNDNQKLNESYLYLYLKNIQEFLYTKRPASGGQPHMYPKTMMKIKIPLPSLEVQQQIVDELSHIETSIETIESRIAQLKREKDQYKKYGRKAEIREMLKDSEEKILGEVCKIDDSSIKKHPTSYGSENVSQYRFYTGGKTKKLYCEKCDIEFEAIIQNRTNGSGKCNLFIDKNFSVASQTLVYYSNNTNIYTKFIYYYLENNIEKLEKGYVGANHKNMSKSFMEKFKIPIPSQEIQKQCIALFEEKENFIQSIDEKINSEKVYIEELKQLAKHVISSFC
jgi:type I restriction-modification system DNA methylase subunit